MKTTLIAVKLLAALLVACAAPIQDTPQNDRSVEIPPTLAPLKPSPTQPATKASPAPTEKATAAPTPTVQYSDAPLESSVLLMMWSLRHGELHTVDPDTGHDLRGYTSINMGHHFSHAFSPDGKTLAAVTYPGDSGNGGVLHLIDLPTWRDVTTTLKFNSWISTMSFSPDGSRLALAYAGKPTRAHGMPEGYHLASVDVTAQTLIAQTSFDFAPGVVGYAADGASLVVYGVIYDTDTGLNVQPPRAVLLDAADLSVEWELELPTVLDGQFTQKESNGTETYVGWWPAAVFSPDRQALYIVHADEDMLTTVNFTARVAHTVAIGPARSWLEQLLALGAGVAHAKGPIDGATKRAVLSSDGKRLYVVGQTNNTFKDAKGELQYKQTPLGLQVIDAATGVEIARFDTEATEVGISPDGTQLYLRGWSATAWTDVLDVNRLEAIKHLAGQYVTPAWRLDGKPILLASNSSSTYQTVISVLDAESLDEIHVWPVKGYASWLAAP